MSCHHCGHAERVPGVCPSCRTADVSRQGSGTQGLEQALARVVPGVPLVRLDADSVARRGALPELLAAFARPGAAILLGTQMVAKGHDLPAITVAGVLDADAGLQHPDFRAEERAFGLIVQLAGRAGRRRGEPARVIVQAYEPGARAVRMGAAHDVEGFLAGELERRRGLGFPPFGSLVRVVVDGEDPAAVRAGADGIAADLRATAIDVRVLGPAPLHRLRGRSRRALLARADRSARAAGAVAAVLGMRGDTDRRNGLRVVVDVDPQDT